MDKMKHFQGKAKEVTKKEMIKIKKNYKNKTKYTYEIKSIEKFCQTAVSRLTGGRTKQIAR